MIVLGLRTDKPEAELHLLTEKGEIAQVMWQAHRQLSETLFEKIDSFLLASNYQKNNLTGLIVYRGPGSFTGLRIGVTVANTMAWSMKIPIVGTAGEDWITKGVEMLSNGKNETQVVPAYGQEPHITKQRK